MFNLVIRLSTSEIFCFHKISVGIMLEIRSSCVLADLLLISSWLLLIQKNSIYPVMHLEWLLKIPSSQDNVHRQNHIPEG